MLVLIRTVFTAAFDSQTILTNSRDYSGIVVGNRMVVDKLISDSNSQSGLQYFQNMKMKGLNLQITLLSGVLPNPLGYLGQCHNHKD